MPGSMPATAPKRSGILERQAQRSHAAHRDAGDEGAALVRAHVVGRSQVVEERSDQERLPLLLAVAEVHVEAARRDAGHRDHHRRHPARAPQLVEERALALEIGPAAAAAVEVDDQRVALAGLAVARRQQNVELDRSGHQVGRELAIEELAGGGVGCGLGGSRRRQDAERHDEDDDKEEQSARRVQSRHGESRVRRRALEWWRRVRPAR